MCEMFKILQFLLAIAVFSIALNQYRKSIIWNKLNAIFNLFDAKKYSELRGDLQNALIKIEMDVLSTGSQVDDCGVIKITNNCDATNAVTAFLNYLEDFSTAMHAGVLDRRVAFNLMGHAIMNYQYIFALYIENRRAIKRSEDLWTQCERAALEFEFAELMKKKNPRIIFVIMIKKEPTLLVVE